jgi:hypothetical protein
MHSYRISIQTGLAGSKLQSFGLVLLSEFAQSQIE